MTVLRNDKVSPLIDQFSQTFLKIRGGEPEVLVPSMIKDNYKITIGLQTCNMVRAFLRVIRVGPRTTSGSQRVLMFGTGIKTYPFATCI